MLQFYLHFLFAVANMEIFVVDFYGREVTYHVNPTDTIEDVKSKVWFLRLFDVLCKLNLLFFACRSMLK